MALTLGSATQTVNAFENANVGAQPKTEDVTQEKFGNSKFWISATALTSACAIYFLYKEYMSHEDELEDEKRFVKRIQNR